MWKKRNKEVITETVNPNIHSRFREPLNPTPHDIWIKRGFPQGTCLIIGHRGSSFLYPENTLLSFRKAIEEGAHAIECDVQETSDGKFVIMHDSDVDRTTNGTGKVWELTSAHLTQLDAGAWKGAEFADRVDTKVPSLNDVLDIIQGKPLFAILHGGYLTPAQATRMIDVVRTRNMLHQCIIFIRKERIDEIKAQNNDILIMNDQFNSDVPALLAEAIAGDWDVISTSDGYYLAEHTQAAKETRVLTQASTIVDNFATRTQNAINVGINLLLGDNVVEMVSVASANGVSQITPFDVSHLQEATSDGWKDKS